MGGFARQSLVAILRQVARRRAVILGYHGIAPRAPEAIDPHHHWTEPGTLRRHIELLREAGFEFVALEALAERVGSGAATAGLACVTLDDGMQDNHATALPLLTELDVPATVFVISGLIGRPNPWLAPASGARMMDERELRELVEGGFTIGAHTVTHPDLTTLDHDACLAEMRECRATLEAVVGRPVRTFAYPSCRYDASTLAAAREAGFVAAVTCEARGGWRPLELPRALMTGVDGTAAFALKLVDAYQPLRDSPPGRALRAGTRPLRAARARRSS